jgi:hypothetical protein
MQGDLWDPGLLACDVDAGKRLHELEMTKASRAEHSPETSTFSPGSIRPELGRTQYYISGARGKVGVSKRDQGRRSSVCSQGGRELEGNGVERSIDKDPG